MNKIKSASEFLAAIKAAPSEAVANDLWLDRQSSFKKLARKSLSGPLPEYSEFKELFSETEQAFMSRCRELRSAK